jgi:hypothetical protein
VDRVIRKLERDIKIHKKLLAQLANKSKESQSDRDEQNFNKHTQETEGKRIYDLNDTILFEYELRLK